MAREVCVRLLSIFLIFALVISPVYLQAGAAALSGDPAVPCAIFVVVSDEASARPLEKSIDPLRQELLKSPSLAPLSPQAIDEKLRDNPQTTEGLLSRKGLALAYHRAKGQYYDFDFEGAKKTLDEALLKASGPGSEAVDRLGIIEVHLLYALLYRADNNESRALDYMREAARLDPTRVLSEYQYSPKTRELFEKAQGQVRSVAKSTLKVESDIGGASVWINGVLQGKTPLTLENFPEGRHDIVLVHEGMKTFYTTIDLHDSFRVQAPLKRDFRGRASSFVLRQENLPAVSDQIEMATLLGHFLDVPKIIFLSLEEFAWNKRVVARMIDVSYRVSYAPAVAQIENSQDAPYVMNVLAQKLIEDAKVSMGEDPGQFAERHQPEEVILLGSRDKKSILKKPIFWIITGAVVAGLGAGIGVAVGGGGSESPSSTSVSVSGPAPESP